MIIRSRAPVRISFAGGGTDCPPYSDEHGGCVISAAIDNYAYGSYEERSDKKIYIDSADFAKKLCYSDVKAIKYNKELDLIKAVAKNMRTGKGANIFLRSEIPPMSGLGSSAAAFVSLIGLFNHLKRERRMTLYEIAELAVKLEREELKISGGKQDQYASVFGGINFIEFTDNFVRVNPLHLKKDYLLELEKGLVLFYTRGRQKQGHDIIKDQTENYKKNKKSTIEAFDMAKELAFEIKYALLKGDFNRFGKLLEDSWTAKKKFSKYITNPYIDRLYKVAKKNGAIGGKITGAGGGGCMVFYCKPNKEHFVTEALRKAGALPINFTFDFEGLQTWEV